MNLLNDIRILLTRVEHRFRTTRGIGRRDGRSHADRAGMNLQAARGIIYSAWWFDLLLLLLCVNFMLIGPS